MFSVSVTLLTVLKGNTGQFERHQALVVVVNCLVQCWPELGYSQVHDRGKDSEISLLWYLFPLYQEINLEIVYHTNCLCP